MHPQELDGDRSGVEATKILVSADIEQEERDEVGGKGFGRVVLGGPGVLESEVTGVQTTANPHRFVFGLTKLGPQAFDA